MNELPEDEIEYAVRPNKSQIKRDIAELQKFAEALTQLSIQQLEEMQLEEKIYEAVAAAAAMPQKGARKRQLKFITGLLRKTDSEPIVEQLAIIENKSAHSSREHHILEQWRDRLLQQGDTALSELVAEFPEADSQKLRQLMRNANKELQAGKPPKSSRLIYRYLKELIYLA